jgi:hypothetical protein
MAASKGVRSLSRERKPYLKAGGELNAAAPAVL